jgi:hypothetical protein
MSSPWASSRPPLPSRFLRHLSGAWATATEHSRGDGYVPFAQRLSATCVHQQTLVDANPLEHPASICDASARRNAPLLSSNGRRDLSQIGKGFGLADAFKPHIHIRVKSLVNMRGLFGAKVLDAPHVSSFPLPFCVIVFSVMPSTCILGFIAGVCFHLIS